MNPLDLGVIAFIALSAVFAFARGFVREALSIVAWVGAALITLYGYADVFSLVEPLVHNALLAELIAIGGTFIATLVILTIATGFLARLVRASGLSPIDRTLGFVFGLVRGAAIVSLAYLMLDAFVQPNERPPWMRAARSTPYLAQGADMLRTVLPESLRLKSAAVVEETPLPVDAAKEADRAMRALASPTAASPAQPTQAPSYRPSDRRDLNRIIGNQQ